MSNVEFITNRQWDSYARRLERSSLRTHGKSLTATSIARYANCYVVEVCEGGAFVRSGWRKAMKDAAFSFTDTVELP